MKSSHPQDPVRVRSLCNTPAFKDLLTFRCMLSEQLHERIFIGLASDSAKGATKFLATDGPLCVTSSNTRAPMLMHRDVASMNLKE